LPNNGGLIKNLQYIVDFGKFFHTINDQSYICYHNIQVGR
jgi:hypothetical protein